MYDKTKYCSESCVGSDICDFCTHFDFNGDEDGCYVGNGYCNLLEVASEPHDGCEEFVCRNVVRLGKDD